FFSLPIAERKAEWERLRARGQGFVRVDVRLAALRPGLYTVLPHFDDQSDVGQLVKVVCELFVLRPAERAAHRLAYLKGAFRRNQWAAWRQAAVQLRKKHAALAALEPELVARLADAEARAQERQQVQRRMRRVAPQIGGAKKNSSLWWMI